MRRPQGWRGGSFSLWYRPLQLIIDSIKSIAKNNMLLVIFAQIVNTSRILKAILS